MASMATFHDLAGAPVVITGGGSGIGAALVEGFLRQGAQVAFIDVADGADFAQRMGAATGASPLFLQADLTDLAALDKALTAAADAHGPTRVLVNNAANDQRHGTLTVDEAFWDWSVAINLKAAFFAARAVIPGMQSAGGAIVNLTSISYMRGLAGYPVYTASKAGITGLTRSLAREFGPEGIRINAIAPGWVLTEKQLEKWATPEALRAELDLQCLKTHLAPADIVGAALFLASDASRMITGQTLAVDGGVVASG